MAKKDGKGAQKRLAPWDQIITSERKHYVVYWKSPDYPYKGRLQDSYSSLKAAKKAAQEHRQRYLKDDAQVYRVLTHVTGVQIPASKVQAKRSELLRTLALCAGINPYGSVENEQARDAALELLKEMR